MSDMRKKSSPTHRTRARRATKMPRGATPVLKNRLSRDAKATLLGGAVVVATAAAATGAILMRRQLGKLALELAKEAVSAGDSVGKLGNRVGTSMRQETKKIDFERLLAYAGLKRRPSLMSRILAPMGILAGVVAAAGAAVFIFLPKLRAPADDAFEPERTTTPPSTGKVDGVKGSDISPRPNGTVDDVRDIRAVTSYATK
jgi:hypothetical protein